LTIGANFTAKYEVYIIIIIIIIILNSVLLTD